MPHLLSIDPGLSSGIAVFNYSTRKAPTLLYTAQPQGGLLGLVDHLNGMKLVRDTVVICEKFTPRPNAKFNLTLDSVEPLRIEGYLVGTGMMPDYSKDEPRWRQPMQQYLQQSGTKAEKKIRNKQFLKEHSFYHTGSQVGHRDADDVHSAIMHGVLYLRDIRNKPAINRYFPRGDE